ncbi:MAG: hypothetical protein ACXVH3_21610 [Solirubrobacteraceae bacterium]
MSRSGSRAHMTREQAGQVKVGDVILVGVRKDRPAVVNAIYGRGIAPPYFATTAEPGFTSWRLAALPQESAGEAA